MLLPHNKVSGGVQDSQIMIPSFFDRFYVMPPLTNGVHYSPGIRFPAVLPEWVTAGRRIVPRIMRSGGAERESR